MTVAIVLLCTILATATALGLKRWDRWYYEGRASYDPFERRCRACGCTDSDCRACIARTGAPCWWVEADLCSACASHVPGTAVLLDPDRLGDLSIDALVEEDQWG